MIFVIKGQRGVVLIVSLVFLVALTAVAAALMQNSTTDIKMSGASEEKVVAVQAAISAVDELIFNQVAPAQTNLFARPISGENFPVKESKLFSVVPTDIKAEVDNTNNKYQLEIDCPHLKVASSTNTFTCNMLKIQINKKYGRKGHNEIVVNSGIAQQLLKKG
jgi:hypothetical protein